MVLHVFNGFCVSYKNFSLVSACRESLWKSNMLGLLFRSEGITRCPSNKGDCKSRRLALNSMKFCTCPCLCPIIHVLKTEGFWWSQKGPHVKVDVRVPPPLSVRKRVKHAFKNVFYFWCYLESVLLRLGSFWGANLGAKMHENRKKSMLRWLLMLNAFLIHFWSFFGLKLHPPKG